MKAWKRLLIVLAAAALAGGVPLRAQRPAQGSAAIRLVLENIVKNENQMVKTISGFSPRVETYVQEIHTGKDQNSSIVGDDYFLGRLKVDRGVVETSFLPTETTGQKILNALLLYKPFLSLISFKINPNAFASPIFIDPQHFDLQHYQFVFVGREFLGTVRCLVFNVEPRPHAGKGLFIGRMWVEDQGYHIVRFNGKYEHHSAYEFHFDSWRENLQPGLWLPVYVYSEESNLAKYGVPHLGFRSQTRLWGYVLRATTPEQELTQVLVDAKTPMEDKSVTSRDQSPLASVRDWRLEAEDNILTRLQKAGLIAPPGPVDKVLETVVNNLIVTNHLDNLPTVRCRVLMTDPLESFTIGNTIVVSRGLLDVLPDESSLAMILAHELGHIVLGDTVDTKYAFYDRMMISDDQLLKRFDFAHPQANEEAADKKAIELLKNSPYKDKLGRAGLFLRAMVATASQTPNLFGAHLGNRLIDQHEQIRMAELLQSAPQLKPASLKQIAALPLGSRIKVDAWSDDLTLLKTKPETLISPKDKMPFEITPMMPYLTRLKTGGEQQQAGR